MTQKSYKHFVLYSGNEQGWGWEISVRISTKGHINIRPPSGNKLFEIQEKTCLQT